MRAIEPSQYDSVNAMYGSESAMNGFDSVSHFWSGYDQPHTVMLTSIFT